MKSDWITEGFVLIPHNHDIIRLILSFDASINIR